MGESELKQPVRTSGILQQGVKLEKVIKKEATHFALCNGNKIRYLIAINGGKKRLSRNISTYSYKLSTLMKLLAYVPFFILKIGRLGYFVCAELNPIIETHFEQLHADYWNMIIGTYNEKQKLVLQCFKKSAPLAIFIKVGNIATESEMKAEMRFLIEKHYYKSFKLPKLLKAEGMSDSNLFNIQITEEFVGNKIVPGLSEEIVYIYQEISSSTQTDNDERVEFSHGDFAPWNIKKDGSNYIVFDWENCGMRIKGFDLMHYVVVPKVLLEGKCLEEAYDEGLAEIQRLLPGFTMVREQFEAEYRALRME